jgi:putative transport protein
VIDFLVDNPFVLLFLVRGIGYLIGKVRVGGFGLGVSAVLFSARLRGCRGSRCPVRLQFGLSCSCTRGLPG